MVREYKWQLRVRSYETDAWGLVPTSGILRYLEQSAVDAAASAGYGDDFHRERGSSWVVRRMTLLMHAPISQGDELEISTWASHFVRVRGGREYCVKNISTGKTHCIAIAEWVYINRRTFAPMAVPAALGADFDVPGAPLQTYEPPTVESGGREMAFTTERTVEWHEIDSMKHVNNAVYADWLDDALRTGLEEAGWSAAGLKEQGLHLRGEYYNLTYRQAAMPGDRLRISTTLESTSGPLCALRHVVTTDAGTELLTAESIYSWRDSSGNHTIPPEEW
jgi:YbgC/YbaW family acyl-CoA thioester hydrolase